jgi:hypothetical protein
LKRQLGWDAETPLKSYVGHRNLLGKYQWVALPSGLAFPAQVPAVPSGAAAASALTRRNHWLALRLLAISPVRSVAASSLLTDLWLRIRFVQRTSKQIADRKEIKAPGDPDEVIL